MAVRRRPQYVSAGLANANGLYAIRPLCLWRTAPLQLPLVTLYKCYAFTFTFYTREYATKIAGSQWSGC